MKTFAARFRLHTLLLLSSITALGLLVALLGGLEAAAQAQKEVPLPGPRLDGAVRFPLGTGQNPAAAVFPPVGNYSFIPSQDDLTVVAGTQVITSFVGLLPSAAQVNPGDGYLYAFTRAQNGGDAVEVVDGMTIVAQIPLGSLGAWGGPRVMAVNPGSGYVYVAPGFTQNEVLALAGGRVVTSIPVPLPPIALTAEPRSGRMYVTLAQPDRVAVIAGTQVIGEVALPAGSYKMAAHPSTGYVYAAGFAYAGFVITPTVSVISGTSLLNVLPAFGDIMVPDLANNLFYLGARGAVTVTAIDGAEVAGTILPGGQLTAMATNAKTGYAYLATSGSNLVTVVSGTQIVATVAAAQRAPRVIAADPNSARVYVGGFGTGLQGGTLGIVSGTQTLATLALDGLPDDLSVDPRSGDVYVASGETQNVTLVRNGVVAGSIRQAAYPASVAYDPFNGYTYVADTIASSVNRVWAVNGQSIVAEIPAPSGSRGGPAPGGGSPLAVDSRNGRVYVANFKNQSIGTIQGIGYTGAITGLSGYPYQLALDPSGRYLYAAEVLDRFMLAVVDGGRLAAELPGMPDFFRVKINPVTGLAYAFGNSNLVHVVNGAAEVGTLRMKSQVTDVTFDLHTGDVYIADADGVALARGHALVGYLPVELTYQGDRFGPLAYDPVHRYLYSVAGGFGRTLVISGTQPIATLDASDIEWFRIEPDPGTGRVYLISRDQFTIITGTQIANKVALPRDLRQWYVDAPPRDVAIDPANRTIYVADNFLHQLTLLAVKPDFNLAPEAAALRIRPGTTTTYTIDLVSQLGFAEPVSLTLGGRRCGISWLILPNPASPVGSATLTLSAQPYAPFGPWSLQLSGASQGIVHRDWVRLFPARHESWLPLVGGGPQRGIEPVPSVWPTRTPWSTPSPWPTSGPTATPCTAN